MIADENNNIDKPLDEARGALKFSGDRQIKIWQALGGLHPELGPRIASMYEGIIIALNSDNPEKISIVCHLARELSSILPIYVSGLPVQQVRASDDDIRTTLNGVLKMLGNGNESDEKIRQIVNGLIAKIPEQRSQKDQLKKVIDSHPVLGGRPAYLNDEFIKQWMRVHQYFVKNSHHHELRNKKANSGTDTELASNWSAFEILIYRVLVKEAFFSTMQEIDRLLKIDAPTEKDADSLMAHIVEPQHRRYFFDRCNNPNWLGLLNKRKAFSSPQEPLKKDGYIQFLPWPESQYLSKVATAKPAEVYEIIKNLTSENQTVLYDFMRAALQSPSDIAAKYADAILKNKWLRGIYNLRLPDEVAELMEKLARDGKTKPALRLADELLSLRADKPTPPTAESIYLPHPTAKPYFDNWQFGEIVKNKTVELAQREPEKLFGIYAAKLTDAIKLEERENQAGTMYEYSHIWRPNLLKARNQTEDAKNIILDGLIDLIEKYQKDSAKLKSFAKILQKHTYVLFRRIEMLLYGYSPDDFIPEAESILRKKEIIVAYNLRREYLPLLGAVHTKISKEARADILKAIDEGPDFKKHEGYTDEQFARICADWKGLYLAPMENNLPEKQAAEYKAIVGKYGKSVDNDGEIITWDGGKSPLSSEEMSKLDAVSTLQFFSEYKEPNDPFGRYSAGGLGMIFAGLVAEKPEKYVVVADMFFEKKIRPIFFYHFINGLKDAQRKNKTFEWKPVIDLCHRIAVVKEYDSVPANADEQDWNSVRRSIADFLGEALGKSTCEITLSEKDRMWEIISDLAEDPEPTPEYERKDGEGGLDPMTLAINTTRGEAIHAVVNYGLWVARNLPDKSIEVKMPPEMVELLDRHLDANKDPSAAIRSVYGHRVPNLFYLNRPWLEANKRKMFPKNQEELLLAAWEGYLANDVIREVFSILKEQYYEFIPHIGKIEKKGYRAADIEQRFPQHVAIVYANESEHSDFVEHFFKTAVAKARAEAINFTGRVILRQIDTFKEKEEVKKRLRDLWDQRISLPIEMTGVEELREFGWWFKSSPFPKRETLERTIKTLQLVKGIIDVPYEIAEELKQYATEFPLESITVLDLLARADRETHEHLYKKEEYRDVIKLVKATGNEEAKKVADGLINYLGSIGLIEEFRDLL